MAIYHYSSQVASRSAGRSAVAMAAYRSGEQLRDERTGEIKFYRRDVKPETTILAPAHAPDWVYDRNRLWNEVEIAEKRKDSQLCREINVALPKEFTPGQQRNVLLDYCQKQFVDRGMIADVSIHRDDPNNPHAHIMLTMRDITSEGFTKKNREWNPDFAFGKVKNAERFVDWRAAWSQSVNHELERMGSLERIDHRSFEDQGITDRLPTIHEGPTVREMEKDGIQTERGEMNRMVQEHNQIVVDLQKYREEKEAIQQQQRGLLPEDRPVLKKAESHLKQPATIERIDDATKRLDEREQGLLDRQRSLQDQLHPFKVAERHFDNIDQWNTELRKTGGVGRFLRRDTRESYRRLEQQIAKAKQDLQTLGFKNRGAFELRKEKVFDFTEKELSGIQKALNEIPETRHLLVQSKQVLQDADARRIAAQYPDWPAAIHLNYEGAKALQAVNDKVGYVASIPQIRSSYEKRSEQLQDLQDKINAINQLGRRLHGAEQWLDKYEKQSKEARHLFTPRERKKDLRREMQLSTKMMKDFGINDREDFNAQRSEYERSLQQKAVYENEATKLVPSYGLLSGAVEAIDRASRSFQMEKERQEWQRQVRQMARSKTRQQHHSYDQER